MNRKLKISFLSLFAFLGQLVFLAGCLNPLKSTTQNTGNNPIKPHPSVYNFEYFDTQSTITSYAGDDYNEYVKNANDAFSLLGEYHKLFDIYNQYEGIVNLRTINLNAGKEALVVDKKLIDFLLYAKEIYSLTNGETNVMMGSVLKLWHDERTNGKSDPLTAKLPDMSLLEEAKLHTSIDLLEIDVEKNTVRISDPKASIDVGAIGKGYATEKAAQLLESRNLSSYVLNIGGNIRILGTKVDGTGWNTGIKNPFYKTQIEKPFSIYLNISDISCVTSGVYERYYTVDGKDYHHIIDKDTLMPSTYFSSLTILTKDSGLADALSTALFSMSYEEGLEIVKKIDNVEVIWIDNEGKVIYTEGVNPIDLKK
jgi:thiamine biosynthesis lipoprotein